MDNLTDTRLPARRAASRNRNFLLRRDTQAHPQWHDHHTRSAETVTPRQARWFMSFMGVAAAAIIAQAAIAGEFVANSTNGGWILAHGLVSYITLGSTLAAAIFTLISFRRAQPLISGMASGLFVLVAVQTVVGYLITVGGLGSLLVVHIPLAFVVFGITGWLSVKATAILARPNGRFRG